MYKIESNDGDYWLRTTIEEALALLRECLEASAREPETKLWNRYEIYWVGDTYVERNALEVFEGVTDA